MNNLQSFQVPAKDLHLSQQAYIWPRAMAYVPGQYQVLHKLHIPDANFFWEEDAMERSEYTPYSTSDPSIYHFSTSKELRNFTDLLRKLQSFSAGSVLSVCLLPRRLIISYMSRSLLSATSS
jgi:hypothetical protein